MKIVENTNLWRFGIGLRTCPPFHPFRQEVVANPSAAVAWSSGVQQPPQVKYTEVPKWHQTQMG